MTAPEPPAYWRTIAPADCVGLPAVSMQYQQELVQLAIMRGIEIKTGDTVTASYRQVDGQWWPIPETLEVVS